MKMLRTLMNSKVFTFYMMLGSGFFGSLFLVGVAFGFAIIDPVTPENGGMPNYQRLEYVSHSFTFWLLILFVLLFIFSIILLTRNIIRERSNNQIT